MKRPAFQWYPGDARRDVAFQSCSFEARALWRELLDLMHDGEPYGHLTAGGVPMTPATIARFVGVPAKKVTAWLAELEEHAVFSRTESGVIFSRRMVKDEHIRNVRAEAGKRGGNPALLDKALVNQSANQTTEQIPTPAVAVASAVAKNIPSSSPPDAVIAVLEALPPDKRIAFLSETEALRGGMHGPCIPESQIQQNARDYLSDNAVDGQIPAAKLSHYRGYLRRQPRAVTPTSPLSVTDELRQWAIDEDAKAAAKVKAHA